MPLIGCLLQKELRVSDMYICHNSSLQSTPPLLDQLERRPEPLRPLPGQAVPEGVPRERLLQRARHLRLFMEALFL